MKLKVIWEFDADVSDVDPKFVDVNGLAADLAKRELEFCLANGDVTADDFDYQVVSEDTKACNGTCKRRA